ncbi:mastermind-like domain-containing protein 1 isoform X1 [Anguilla anguilla]|uniref:mastermind-like domain-containing protein 1 isoform X1 n=1 Tax=Anguilla anguilla TaxID=7936 RepID=UPI0015ABEEA7|nr:mastermind-like domain-containing protein 1 isoform X1 [Anguilla anguilla]
MLLVSQRLDAPRMEPLLPGSVKRKLAAAENSGEVNGVSDGPMIQGNGKRLCLEDVTLAMGPGFQHPPYSSGPGVGGHSAVMEGNGLNNNGLGSPYAMPPKASPGSAAGGGGGAAHGGMLPSFNPNGNSSAPSVEQELQDILDELTKNPDPSLTELDIEKILGNKGDEQAGGAGGFMHPEGSGTPKRSPQRPSHLESHLTRSPGFTQAAAAGSPQVGPSPPYSLPHPAKPVPSPLSASPLSSSAQTQSQARSPMLSAALSNRAGSAWHEVSRAQQLQQMASNSKHMSAGTAPPPPQPSPWTGPSPPYRPSEKLPSSSPHQQPFSPAGSIQSPQSALISGMAPAPSAGPSPPYRPEKLASPALAQPPFSPQGALLASAAPAGGAGGSAQSSQAGFLPNMPPSSGSTRPSPPYRTDKHSSPTVQQQAPQQQQQPPLPPQAQTHSFSSQNGSASMASQLFKAMTSGPPSSLKLLMQQQQQQQQQNQPSAQPQSQPQLPPAAHQAISKAGPGQDPYSFNNTKPLRHFDPEPPAQKLGPLVPGQGSLGHYPGPNMQQAPPVAGAGHSQLLQQQQEMQQRMQRSMQAGGMAPHSRADQSPGMVPRLQDPSAVPRPTQSSNYNMLLKSQLIKKHILQQEKQRQMEQMNGGQMSDCQQVVPFQGVGRSLPSECGFPMGTPPANPAMLSHSPMLSGRMGALNQPGRGGGAFMGNAGPKPALYHQEFSVPLQPGQGMMGMGVPPRQPMHHSQAPARSGMPGPSFQGGPLQPQHLRHALHQGGALPRMVFNPQQPSQPQSQLWQQQQQGHPRMGCDTHMDPGLHQHAFPGRGAGGGPPQFSQQPLRSGMPANFTPHQTGAPPPNQVAPNLPGRHMQKLPPGHPHPSMAQQGLRPRGPLSAMAVMKPVPLGMVPPAHGMAPPSYSSSSKHPLGMGYGSGNPGHKLPAYECAQHQSNGGMPGVPGGGGGGGTGEVDFIETLVGSNEDWLNNLTMIDEYLEQNS